MSVILAMITSLLPLVSWCFYFRPTRLLLLLSLQPFVVARYVWDQYRAVSSRGANLGHSTSLKKKKTASAQPSPRRVPSMSAVNGDTNGVHMLSMDEATIASNPSVRNGSVNNSPTRSIHHRSLPSFGEEEGSISGGSKSGRRSRTHSQSHRSTENFSEVGSNASGSMYSSRTSVPSSLPDINRMNVIRTADSCFDHLSISYPWDAHYFKIGPMRVHYLDISPDEQEDISEKSKRKTIFLIHGATTWSYLYRNSIQQFLNLGYRVVAIDLPGHGKSDKLSTTQTPLLPLHIAATKHLLNKLLNHNIHPTLVAHGWGALVAARAMQVCGEFRVRGTRLVVVGGYGLLSEIHRPSKEAELHLLAASWYYVTRPWTPLSTVINAGIIIPSGVPLNSNDAMGYDVAYPTSSHGLSPTTLPLLVPLPVPSPIIRPLLALCPPVQRAFSAADLSEDLELAREFFGNAEERGRMYSRTVAGDMRMVPPVRRRYLVICGENDPLWHSTATKLATHAGCRSVFLPHAGHYVPEDQPAELVRIIHAFITEH